jgi:hypothetical protein
MTQIEVDGNVLGIDLSERPPIVFEGPGEYRPDSMIGIDGPDDLPKIEIGVRSRSHRRRTFPRCGPRVYRDRIVRRTVHDHGDPRTVRPSDIVCTRSRAESNNRSAANNVRLQVIRSSHPRPRGSSSGCVGVVG